MELHEVDYKVPNGKLIRLQAEIDSNKIKEIKINGDFFLYPEEKIAELEQALIGKPLEEVTLQPLVSESLSGCEMVGISPEEIVTALLRLV